MEKRGGALVDLDRAVLSQRMKTYFNAKIEWSSYSSLGGPLSQNAARFDAERCRNRVIKKKTFTENKIVRYLVRPFDIRFAYYSDVRPLWNEPRPQLWDQYKGGNQFLVTRPTRVADPEGVPFASRVVSATTMPFVAMRTTSRFRSRKPPKGCCRRIRVQIFPKKREPIWKRLEITEPPTGADLATYPCSRLLAALFDRKCHADYRLASDSASERECAPSKLGRVGSETDGPAGYRNGIPSVTGGSIAEHLRVIGLISAPNLKITARWGHNDSQGRVYPGQGQIKRRDWTETERGSLSAGFALLGLSEDRGFELFGRAIDVYLNDTTCWRAVPERVWEYYLGGYQVIKKWLSYREETVLGRALTTGEAREVTATVRRLASIVLMGDKLDANYTAVRDNAFQWQTTRVHTDIR